MTHNRPHTFAMVARTLRPSKGDGGVMLLALAAPFLMGQASGEGAQSMGAIELAIAGVITAGAGLIAKALIVAIAAGMRAYRAHTRRTLDGSDDVKGLIVGAMADALDPEHAGQDPTLPPQQRDPP